MERLIDAPACEHEGCNNFARSGHTTCRWHDPEVVRLREEAEAARLRYVRAAGVGA